MSMREEFLLPGDLVTARGAAHFRTLLGSCVSICLTNVQRGIFGMTHFMLPTNPGRTEPGRYGDTSTQKVLASLLAMDADPRHYSARVYGGGSLVKSNEPKGSSIGDRNIDIARKLLKHYQIRVTEEDVGGQFGRKLDFWTSEDKVHCRLIKDQHKDGPSDAKNKGGLRVVVVDDSQAARAVIRAGLEQAGMQVVGEAEDAFEAREVVVQQEPDVITLDLEMPRLDGITFLRQLSRYFPTPVVVVSSSAPSGSARAREALEAGAQAVVDKADLEMASAGSNLGKLLVPRVKLAALSRLGSRRRTE